MYQVLQHALSDPQNKTKFTLIFANVTPKDILLKEEFDALKAKHPNTFNVVYTVDKPDDSWNGTVGYVNKTLIQQHIPPASLAEKVKILVCGPPGQVSALAGKKDGMKQGALSGILKELGYTEDQVSTSLSGNTLLLKICYRSSNSKFRIHYRHCCNLDLLSQTMLASTVILNATVLRWFPSALHKTYAGRRNSRVSIIA